MTFPILNTVDPIIDLVKDLPEFKISENHEHGFGYISYMVAFEDTFGDLTKAKTEKERLDVMLRREARGIKYDLKTHQVVGRTYHKFFNANERAETNMGKVDMSQEHHLLDKLDGSMVSPYRTPSNKLIMLTKKGISDVGALATGWSAENQTYRKFYDKIMDQNKTPIFEWCSRKSRIVIDYPTDRMVLTAIRDNVTGEYDHYDAMRELALENNIDVVQAYKSNFNSLDAIIGEIRHLLDMEGIIVRFTDGNMLKIKGEWYCAIHRVASNFKFEKDIIRMLVSETIDDAKPFLGDDLKEAADKFHHALIGEMKRIASEIYWETVTAHDRFNGSAKRFAEYIQGDLKLIGRSKVMFKAYREELSEEEIYNQIVAIVLGSCSTASKVEAIRHHYLGDLRWESFALVKDQLDDD